MAKQRRWKLLEADELFKTEPEFFVYTEYPKLDYQTRCSAQIGETVKVTAKIEKADGQWKTIGIWLQVEDNSNAPGSFVGRPRPDYRLRTEPKSDGAIVFGPENIYRMEPREFTVWGQDNQPVIVWGRKQTPQLDGISSKDLTPLKTVSGVNGWLAFKFKYAELALENGWDEMDKLPGFKALGC